MEILNSHPQRLKAHQSFLLLIDCTVRAADRCFFTHYLRLYIALSWSIVDYFQAVLE